MLGNIPEWCEDVYYDGYNGAPADGSAWKDDNSETGYHVIRGGSYRDHAVYCRCASRSYYDCEADNNSIGFRIVFST